MNFLPSQLDDYIDQHSAQEPALLAELWRETHLKILQPRMMSGPYQGRLLKMLVQMNNPNSILELGTFSGYSTICMLEGLKAGGTLTTVDIEEERAGFVAGYIARFRESALSPGPQTIHQVTQDALKFLEQDDKTYDLIFLDADKPRYPQYAPLCIEKLNPGGVLLSDNTLWSGKVVEPLNPKDTSTAALLEFNKFVAEHDDLETVVLGIRDGLTLSRKRTK